MYKDPKTFAFKSDKIWYNHKIKKRKVIHI